MKSYERTRRKRAARHHAVCHLLVAAALLGILPAGSARAAPRAADSDIAFWVRDALRSDPRVDAAEVAVHADEGIVTLSGYVDNLAEKQFADLEAKKIGGVLGVVDQIEVRPGSRPGAEIVHDIRRHLLSSSVVESQKIGVTCVDDKIILSGEVYSWDDKEEARQIASQVRGVREVVDEISVAFRTPRTDAQIQADARAILERDVYLNNLPIAVSVKRGVVTLTGTVGNAYEKERASRELQFLSHVDAVKNELRVEWLEELPVRTDVAAIGDQALRQAVQAELNADTRLSAADISIGASSGHIVLDGSVPTYHQKRIAAQDARDVVGVGWVSNNLYVHTLRRDNRSILGDIRSNLFMDYSLEGFDIDVKVKDGIVTLSGKTHTLYDRIHTEEIVARVQGVRQVIDEITVDKGPQGEDALLARSIENRLKANWVTAVSSDSIDVRVQNGVAVLTGTVENWRERVEAGQVAAHTEWIWLVDNRLSVHGYAYPWDDWYYRNPYTYDLFSSAYEDQALPTPHHE